VMARMETVYLVRSDVTMSDKMTGILSPPCMTRKHA
jgi:hypothetical protein